MRPFKLSWPLASRALFLVILGAILCTFADYGMSWDQYYRQTEGAKKLTYYENLFAGKWQKYDNPEDNYPGFYDLTLQVVNKFQPCGPGILGLIYTDHLLTALAGLLTIIAAYKVGKRLGGARAGFFSALFLCLFPHFYGHVFINPKDIPFACGYLWSLYFTLKLVDQRLDWRLVASLILIYGLTLGVRLGGVFLFAFMGLALLMRAYLKRNEGQIVKKLIHYAGIGVLVVFGAFLVLLPWWPFAHPNPIGSIMHSLTQVASYPWNGPVILNGKVYPATELPWYYLPEMLIVTAPEFLLGLGLMGIIFVASSLIRRVYKQFSKAGGVVRRLPYLTPKRLGIFFIAFALFFPIAGVIVKNSTLYDGIRHFLFILGPWAVLAALTLERILTWLQNRVDRGANVGVVMKNGKRIVYLILILASVSVIFDYIRLHPYQYVYYNRLVGGIEKAYANFETDYWGTSHREAVELLAQKLAREGDAKPYKVTSPMAPWLVENFLPANLTYTTDGREADFFISFLRFNAHMWSDGRILEDCIVQRAGVPLAIVRDRREIVKKETQAHQQGRPGTRLISGVLDILPLFN